MKQINDTDQNVQRMHLMLLLYWTILFGNSFCFPYMKTMTDHKNKALNMMNKLTKLKKKNHEFPWTW